MRHGKPLQVLALLLWLVLKTQLFWSPAVIVHQVKFLSPLPTCLSALKQTSANKAPGKAIRCQIVSKKQQDHNSSAVFSSLKESPKQASQAK